MSFRNQQAFNDPKSRLAAAGADLRLSKAVTDAKGRVLFYAQHAVAYPLRACTKI